MKLKNCYVKLEKLDVDISQASNHLNIFKEPEDPIILPELNIKSRPTRLKIKKEPLDDCYFYYDTHKRKKFQPDSCDFIDDPETDELQTTHSLKDEPQTYFCNECGYSDILKINLKNHFKDKLCPFNSYGNIERDINKFDTNLFCPFCLMTNILHHINFADNESLAYHLAVVHRDLLGDFITEEEINNIDIYGIDIYLPCELRNQFIKPNKESSLNHMYICCGENFTNRLLLNKHMKKDHGFKSLSIVKNEDMIQSLTCDIKNDLMENEIILTTHNMLNEIYLEPENELTATGQETILNFNEKHSYNEFSQNCSDEAQIDYASPCKEPQFTSCPYCEETFKSKILMRIHIANVHPSEEFDHSSYEELEFFKSKRHKRSKKHKYYKDENMVFICDICSRSFLKRSHLNRHMASAVHSDVLVHRCGYCGLRFDSNLSLREHLIDFFYHKDPEISRIPKYVCYLCTFPHILGIGSIDSAKIALNDPSLTLQQQLLLQPLISNISGIPSIDQEISDANDFLKEYQEDINQNAFCSSGVGGGKYVKNNDLNSPSSIPGLNKKKRRKADLMLRLVTELLASPYSEDYKSVDKKEPIPSVDYIIDEKTGEQVALNDRTRLNIEDNGHSLHNNYLSKKLKIIKVTRFRSKEELLRHMYYVHPREYLFSKTTTAHFQKWLDRQHSNQNNGSGLSNNLFNASFTDLDPENQKAIEALDPNILLTTNVLSPSNLLDDEPPFFLLSHSLQITEEGRHSQMFLHEPRLGIVSNMVNVAYYSKDNPQSEYFKFAGENFGDTSAFKSECTIEEQVMFQTDTDPMTSNLLFNQDESIKRQLSAGSVLLGLNPNNQTESNELLLTGNGNNLLFDGQNCSLNTTPLPEFPNMTTSLNFDISPLGGVYNSGPMLNLYNNSEYEDPSGSYQILRLGDYNSVNPFFTRVRRRTRHDLGDSQGHRCKVCGKVLAYDRSLKQHIRAMHPHEWARIERERMRRFASGFAERRTRFDLRCEPGHLCEFCGKTLAYDRSLKQHIKNVHRTLILASQGLDVLTTSQCIFTNDGRSQGRTVFESTLPAHLQEWKMKNDQEGIHAANELLFGGNNEIQLQTNDMSNFQMSPSNPNIMQLTRVDLDDGSGKFVIVETPIEQTDLNNSVDGVQTIEGTSLLFDSNSSGNLVLKGNPDGTYVLSENGNLDINGSDLMANLDLANGAASITYNEYGQPILNYSFNNQQTLNQQSVKRRTRFDLTGPGFLCNFCGKTLAYDRSLKQHIKTMHREEWIKMAKNKMLSKASSSGSVDNIGLGSVTAGLGRRGAAPPLIQSLLWGGETSNQNVVIDDLVTDIKTIDILTSNFDANSNLLLNSNHNEYFKSQRIQDLDVSNQQVLEYMEEQVLATSNNLMVVESTEDVI